MSGPGEFHNFCRLFSAVWLQFWIPVKNLCKILKLAETEACPAMLKYQKYRTQAFHCKNNDSKADTWLTESWLRLQVSWSNPLQATAGSNDIRDSLWLVSCKQLVSIVQHDLMNCWSMDEILILDLENPANIRCG